MVAIFSKAVDQAKDRVIWEPVLKAQLRTYVDALRQYALYPETNFFRPNSSAIRAANAATRPCHLSQI
jgi:hypothetical protein